MTTIPQPGRGDIIAAEQHGVRVFWIATETMQEFVDRLALILGEHMANNDELHVTCNGMLGGWQEHPGRNASVLPLRGAQAPWTQLEFEYSTFVVLRGRPAEHE